MQHNQEQLLVALHATTNSTVSQIVDRGITRIQRSRLVGELLDNLINAVCNLAVAFRGDAVKIDTVATCFTIKITDNDDFDIKIEGDEDVCETLHLQIIKGDTYLNNNPITKTSLVVLVTSHLLRCTNSETLVTINP